MHLQRVEGHEEAGENIFTHTHTHTQLRQSKRFGYHIMAVKMY